MQNHTQYPTPKTNWLASAFSETVKKACQDLAKQAVDRYMRNERIRMALDSDEQTRLIRLQLHQDRRKRIEAGSGRLASADGSGAIVGRFGRRGL